MARPAPSPGAYIIVNRVLSPDDERLAITYNGQSNAVTVTPKKDGETQRWIIEDFGSGKSSVVSYNSQKDQAA